jgi:hypothetical protein
LKGQNVFEEFDELTDEDEKILDKIWDEIAAEEKLEEQGLGKPKWTTTAAKQCRPDLKKEDLKEWMRIANEEYRRLRMKKIDSDEARQKSEKVANRKVPIVPKVTTKKTPKVTKAQKTSKVSNVSKVPKTSKKKSPKKET